jgi:hypothetical protein
MKIKDLIDMFATGYAFHKETGLPASSWHNWNKYGYIPILSQLKIEMQTNGKLKASLADAPKPKKRSTKNGNTRGVDV